MLEQGYDDADGALLILSRIQTNIFVDCAARLLTVLVVLLRRRSLASSILF
jgi:hypothetical protein